MTSKATHVKKQGKENWQTKHLPTEAHNNFENLITPLVRLNAGALSNPWQALQVDKVQGLVDNVTLGNIRSLEMAHFMVWYVTHINFNLG